MSQLYAGELALDYDYALLRLTDVTLNDRGRRPLLARRDGDGRVGIAFASARPIASSGSLVEVTFEASRDISRRVESSIRASHLRLNGSIVATDFVFPFRIEPWQTRLMPNYSNPFNPDTWIPFELAEDSEGTVRIYGIAGELVRALDLGALPVGEYVGRGRAAYWDGANEQGERVASGTYVYGLAAGEYRALRRMVIMK
ncbi:MAG: FlgD immunoglobulin-like domain containing protein [Candidatus Poribacteria bacterium]